jgi:phage recombination protein Bet
MANVIAIRQPAGALTRRDGRRLDLFRRTVGKDLKGPEIDEAVEWCEIFGANPFVKDIYFFVFDADKLDKRRVVPVLGIGLYRKIAARTGNYRPDEAPPRFAYGKAAKSPINPTGMLWCEVSVNVFSHGAWHPVTSRLTWKERAPIKEVWAWDEAERKRKPTGKLELDPKKDNWHRMPQTMMAKCCEADAIRKAWPNETAGSYVAEELDSAQTIDATATEVAETYAAEQRLKAVGAANAILIQWDANGPIVQVPVGQLGDKAIEFVEAHAEEPMTVKFWAERNRYALQEYWGRDRAGAMALKTKLEPVIAKAAE